MGARNLLEDGVGGGEGPPRNDGTLWNSDFDRPMVGSQVVRVDEGGVVTRQIPTRIPTFACTQSRHDSRTLHALRAPGSRPAALPAHASAAIHAMRVEHPVAGRL